MQKQMIKWRDGSLAYWRLGSGPDLVFIHGWPLHGATWDQVAKSLSKDFTCHLFDLPGSGESVMNEGAHPDFGNFELALTECLESLHIKSFALLAHDSGGITARELAASMGDKVWALVLGNTELSNHASPHYRRTIAALKRVPFARSIFRATIGSKTGRIAAFGSCFTDKNTVNEDFNARFLVPLREDDELLRNQFRLLRTFEPDKLQTMLTELHPRIVSPVHFIWGDADIWFPINYAKEMMKEFSSAVSLDSIPRGRLFPHDDHWEEWVRSAKTFLTQHAG